MSEYLHILKAHWGFDSFRGIQEDIIESIGSGHDTLGLMPTGGGKSITFQVPALSKPGVCLVISPLIALMKDQVAHLRKQGILAQAIYSGMTRNEVITALENCIFGHYKFLYISPERLESELFRNKIKHIDVSMITVDESHCISQWGYDFRPAYLRIADIRRMLPDAPILALTATATPRVVADIQATLLFRSDAKVFRMSFERKNMAYIVRHTNDKDNELLHILSHTQGSAIVYAHTRQRTQDTARMLNTHGISATFFHAGLNHAERDVRQNKWINNEVRVIVATNAFGMGIDKPDVRLVVHVEAPDSLEAYFQEAGRAGRDGQKAYAVLLYSRKDAMALSQRVTNTYPPLDYIRQVYEDINYFYQMAMGDGYGCVREFNLEKFCTQYKHFPARADSALKIIAQAGYLEYTEEQENQSRLMFLLKRHELYHLKEYPDETEQVIQAVLRTYPGLFADYTFINESTISTYTGVPADRVYQILVMLRQHGIIDYVPRKRTPYIIYSQERLDCNELHFSPAVYADRRAQFEQRIKAMVGYITSDDTCRSRMLLHYFGEHNPHNCGQCDTCLARHESGLRQGQFQDMRDEILQALRAEPTLASHWPGSYAPVIHYLIAEHHITFHDGLLSLAQVPADN